MPLASSTAHIIQMPSDSTAVQRYVEDMLGDTHRLNARVKDVIYGHDQWAYRI